MSRVQDVGHVCDHPERFFGTRLHGPNGPYYDYVCAVCLARLDAVTGIEALDYGETYAEVSDNFRIRYPDFTGQADAYVSAYLYAIECAIADGDI